MPGGEFSSPRTMHEPAPVKKLTTDELKHSADRLSTVSRKEVQLPPLVEKRTLSDDQMKQSLERLYAHTLEHKKKMIEELDKKAHPDMAKHVTLDQDVLQSAFQRLHDKSMEQKKETLKKLKEKYVHPGADKKVLSSEELQASAQRLCNASMEAAKKAHADLYDKYVVQSSAHFPKLSKEQQVASAARLCTTKK